MWKQGGSEKYLKSNNPKGVESGDRVLGENAGDSVLATLRTC